MTLRPHTFRSELSSDVRQTTSHPTISKNKNLIPPFTDKDFRYFILFKDNSGKNIESLMKRDGFEFVISPPRSELTHDVIFEIIDSCDVFILISSRTPNSKPDESSSGPKIFDDACNKDPDLAFLWYASSQNRECVHLTFGEIYNFSPHFNLIDTPVTQNLANSHPTQPFQLDSLLKISSALIRH